MQRRQRQPRRLMLTKLAFLGQWQTGSKAPEDNFDGCCCSETWLGDMSSNGIDFSTCRDTGKHTHTHTILVYSRISSVLSQILRTGESQYCLNLIKILLRDYVDICAPSWTLSQRNAVDYRLGFFGRRLAFRLLFYLGLLGTCFLKTVLWDFMLKEN